MPTGVLVAGIAAVLCVVLMLVFLLVLRRRYLMLLPNIFRSAANAVIRNLSGIKGGGVDKVPAIESAFKTINYEPLQRRWAQCMRDFNEIGGHRAFLDVDEFFRMKPLLEEALERRNAVEAGQWLAWSGALSACIVTAAGFIAGGGAQLNPYMILGMAAGTLAIGIAISIEYRWRDARTFEACMEDYTDMLARLKECLPPVGRDSLIQTLYLMQNEQSENLKKQTEELKKTLTGFATETLALEVGSRFDASIEHHLAPSIQKMADVQTSVLTRLQHDQQHRMDQLFNLFTKEVGDLLSKQLAGMTDQVNKSAAGMREIVGSLHTVAQDVQTTHMQNRETADRNEVLLKSLNETHIKLMERFGEATILLDDILNSSKILSETTTNANVATIELAEQAGRLQRETGEKFDQLRTTFDERLTASTNAALSLQASLAVHAEEIRTGLSDYAIDLKTSFQSYSDQLQQHFETYSGSGRTWLESYSSDIMTSLGEFVHQTREEFRIESEMAAAQRRQESEALFSSMKAQIDAMRTNLSETLEQAQAMNLETAGRFGAEAQALFAKYEKQNQEVAQELQAQGRTNANLLSLTNKTLTETTATQVRAFESQTASQVHAFESQSEKMMQGWKENAATFYASLHDEARGLLQLLPDQMKEAFNAFTASMAETMRSTLTDSVEIIDKLGERIQQLHSEFELYFSRTEGNTEALISDMRFAMEGAIGKFTEMSDASLTQMRDGNQEALLAQSQQTRQLMDAVEEQTRTLSLYIKDMGIDLAELNKGLKESVGEFSTHLHEGVTGTFAEFDKGMAEVVHRMTELGVRIEESVEALPDTLERMGGGRRQ